MLYKMVIISFVLQADVVLRSNAATLRLYKGSVDCYEEVLIEHAYTLLALPCYKPDCPNLVYTFGFTGEAEGPNTRLMISSCMEALCINVFLFNWQKEASKPPLLQTLPNSLSDPAAYVLDGMPAYLYMGVMLGKALAKMADTGLFKLDCTTLVGHSLGAHVHGMAGRWLLYVGKPNLDRISGCDCASELFDRYVAAMPALNKDCAKFVDVMHTDPCYSSNESIATADIWVNRYIFLTKPEDQQVQPGCGPRGTDRLSRGFLCSHTRCVELWAQSFKTVLTASKAKDSTCIDCEIPATTTVGNIIDRSARGDYLMETTGSPPYQPVPTQ